MYEIRKKLIRLNVNQKHKLLDQNTLQNFDLSIIQLSTIEDNIKELHKKLKSADKADSATIKNLLNELCKEYASYVWLLDDLDMITQEAFINYKDL